VLPPREPETDVVYAIRRSGIDSRAAPVVVVVITAAEASKVTAAVINSRRRADGRGAKPHATATDDSVDADCIGIPPGTRQDPLRSYRLIAARRRRRVVQMEWLGYDVTPELSMAQSLTRQG
jgi:hypothetical protein